MRILREKGIGGLYAGWNAYFVLCLKPAITYALFNTVRVTFDFFTNIGFIKRSRPECFVGKASRGLRNSIRNVINSHKTIGSVKRSRLEFLVGIGHVSYEIAYAT